MKTFKKSDLKTLIREILSETTSASTDRTRKAYQEMLRKRETDAAEVRRQEMSLLHSDDRAKKMFEWVKSGVVGLDEFVKWHSMETDM